MAMWVMRPTDFPTLARLASGRKYLGASGVKHSSPTAAEYSTDVQKLKRCGAGVPNSRQCLDGQLKAFARLRAERLPGGNLGNGGAREARLALAVHAGDLCASQLAIAVQLGIQGEIALPVCVLQVATLRSASKDCPKRVATVSRPMRPRPSFRTQLMPAAVGRDLAAPTPTARSRLCKQTLQSLVGMREHAACPADCYVAGCC